MHYFRKLPIILPLLLGGLVTYLLHTPTEAQDPTARKKIVFIAGPPSHGPGEHEHRAGCTLLADHLQKSGLPVDTLVITNGWPQDESVFDGASAVIIYATGGTAHPANAHLDTLNKLVAQGVGIGALHYAVETIVGPPAETFLNSFGGYFEAHWSVNPHWTPHFKMVDHPVARGINDYEINDEWYYHMRFRKDMEGITPILSALPPTETLNRGEGSHQGNPDVRAAVLDRKEPQHTMWVFQRPDTIGGGRGFGFTGGHFHKNWANDNQRRVVLNAITWIAGLDVPTEGVKSPTPTEEEMLSNLDPK